MIVINNKYWRDLKCLSIQCEWKKADDWEEDMVGSPQVMEQVNENETLAIRNPTHTDYIHQCFSTVGPPEV